MKNCVLWDVSTVCLFISLIWRDAMIESAWVCAWIFGLPLSWKDAMNFHKFRFREFLTFKPESPWKRDTRTQRLKACVFKCATRRSGVHVSLWRMRDHSKSGWPINRLSQLLCKHFDALRSWNPVDPELIWRAPLPFKQPQSRGRIVFIFYFNFAKWIGMEYFEDGKRA